MNTAVVRILDLKKQGKNAGQIAKVVNKEGLKTVTGRAWTTANVSVYMYPRTKKGKSQKISFKKPATSTPVSDDSVSFIKEIINSNLSATRKIGLITERITK